MGSSRALISKHPIVVKHLKYANYVLRHKWHVFWAAVDLGIPWLGLVHDWSKFRPSEWRAYARYFYGPGATNRRDSTGYYKPTDTGDPAFDRAWLLHVRRNKHHWQYWSMPLDGGGTKPLPIPDRYRREMLADWTGAGRAQGSKAGPRDWYVENGSKLQLHPDTRKWIESNLGLDRLPQNEAAPDLIAAG